MYLTISKRFEISLSLRFHQPAWSEKRNRAFFGKWAGGEHGFGANYTAYFVFAGSVDPVTGMVINVTTIKERVNRILADRYDHRYLNADTKPFNEIVPTPENIAGQLYLDVAPLFEAEPATLTAVHLDCSPTDGATAYADGRIERHYGLEFSAARRTWSPRLSDEENVRLFGAAASPSGHGHYYTLRATVAGEPDPEFGMIIPPDVSDPALRSLHLLFDHRNLTTDVPELDGLPLTTESLTSFMFERLSNRMPITRVRLWENPWFYTECLSDGLYTMGARSDFRAAHRLHSPFLSDYDNATIYGKCNNPAGHGHRYVVEAAVDGHPDHDSGALFPLEDLLSGVRKATDRYDFKHLQSDTDDFTEIPSTGENIVQRLWPRIEDGLGRSLYRLRLWETPNNRFTLRRTGPDEED